MFHLQVDLGQVILATLIAIVGYFVKKTIDDFGNRIDKHEEILFQMAQDIQFIVGSLGIERRKITRLPKNDK